MEDIPAAFPVVGDDAFRRFRHAHLSHFARRFDAWLTQAPDAFSRPTILHGGRSVAEILRDEQLTAEEDETAFDAQLNAIYELAALCRDFVRGELKAFAFLEQRQQVAIDEILRLAAERVSRLQDETLQRRWLVGLRAIDGDPRVGYAGIGRARVGHSLEDASWVQSAWSIVVEETIPAYLEQDLKPALERGGDIALVEHVESVIKEFVAPERFLEILRSRERQRVEPPQSPDPIARKVKEKKVERRFPERAEFFRKRNLNPMAIELKIGLSHNTTKRILDAKAVRNESLDKLAKYYSIDPRDIPDR